MFYVLVFSFRSPHPCTPPTEGNFSALASREKTAIGHNAYSLPLKNAI
ncbi:MAG: hypothetical protein LBP62_08045 [Clostridiales bacterium]|nr:hypothetical protein [Clostridiales bacterium]